MPPHGAIRLRLLIPVGYEDVLIASDAAFLEDIDHQAMGKVGVGDEIDSLALLKTVVKTGRHVSSRNGVLYFGFNLQALQPFEGAFGKVKQGRQALIYPVYGEISVEIMSASLFRFSPQRHKIDVRRNYSFGCGFSRRDVEQIVRSGCLSGYERIKYVEGNDLAPLYEAPQGAYGVLPIGVVPDRVIRSLYCRFVAVGEEYFLSKLIFQDDIRRNIVFQYTSFAAMITASAFAMTSS